MKRSKKLHRALSDLPETKGHGHWRAGLEQLGPTQVRAGIGGGYKIRHRKRKQYKTTKLQEEIYIEVRWRQKLRRVQNLTRRPKKISLAKVWEDK